MATSLPVPAPSPLAAVEQLHDRLGFTYRELAAAVHADEATLHRWRTNAARGAGAPPSPVYLARLAALQAFVDELSRTFRDEGRRGGLGRPARAGVPGQTARALIRAGHVDRVTGVLYALNAGVFA
jgi:hypothetical protein